MKDLKEQAHDIIFYLRTCCEDKTIAEKEALILQALEEVRNETISFCAGKVKSLDPLNAPGRWEDGSYEEIAEDIHEYFIKQIGALKESSQ